MKAAIQKTWQPVPPSRSSIPGRQTTFSGIEEGGWRSSQEVLACEEEQDGELLKTVIWLHFCREAVLC